MSLKFSAKSQTLIAVSATVLSPAAVNAAIVHITGAPVSMSLAAPVGAIVPWNVDGAGNAEFELRHAFHSSYGAGRTFYDDSVHIASNGPLNGRGFVAYSTGSIAAGLPRSNRVGPTLAPGLTFGSTGASHQIVHVGDDNYGHGPFTNAPGQGFFGVQPGKYIGFAFDPGDGLHYGWAKAEFVADAYDSALTIREWAYETKPGTAIHVGSVPVPAVAPGLALLAMGAAGIRSWRMRRPG